MDSPFGLYGAIPLLVAHSPVHSVGAFWCAPLLPGMWPSPWPLPLPAMLKHVLPAESAALIASGACAATPLSLERAASDALHCSALPRLNAAEMYIDVERSEGATHTQWVAESGVLDLFLLLGPSPREVTLPDAHAARACAFNAGIAG